MEELQPREKTLLADLLTYSEQPFAVGYTDGRLGICNPAFEQLTGYNAEELRSVDWSTVLTPPEYLAMERRQLKQLHENSNPVRYEKEYIRKDGSRVPVSLFVHLSRTPDEAPDHYFAFVTDLTSQKHHEATLATTETRYYSLYAAMSEGMALHEIIYNNETGQASDYRILDVNPAFEKITGISRDDAVGALASGLYGEEDPPYLEVYARVAATGTPAKFETHFSPMTKSFSISVFSSQQGFFATVFEDITDRHRTKQSLIESRHAALNIMQDALHTRDAFKESENRLKRAQETAHLGSWELEGSTGALTWSDEVYRIFGFDPNEFTPTYAAFLDVVHPDDRHSVNSAYNDSLKNNTVSYEIDHRIIKYRTGEVRYVHERCEHQRDNTGEVIRSVGMVLDITERKKVEEKLMWENRLTILANRLLRIFMEESEDTVFEKVLSVILSETGSSHGILGYIAENDHFICPTLSTMMPECTLNEGSVDFPPEKWKGLWAQALHEKQSFQSNAHAHVPDGHIAIENNLATPIIFQDQVIGLLNQANKPGGYSNDDLKFAENITHRFAPVLYAWMQRKLRETERATAHALQQKALRRFELLARTASELLHSDKPQQILEQLCTKVMTFLDCQLFINFLSDQNSDRLYLNACAGIPDAERINTEWLDYGVSVCGCVARDGCRIIAEDIQSGNDERTARVKSYGIQAYACHPLLAPGGRVIGTLSFGTKTRTAFSTDDIDLMRAVADQVSAAMIRMMSEQDLRRKREDLKRAQTVGKIGSWWLDAAHNRLLWSDEHYHIFNISPETQITHEKFIALVHPEDRHNIDRKRLENLTGKYDVSECRILVDDTEKWVRITGEFEFDDAGNVTGGFGTTQDITQQKNDTLELQHYRQRLEKLVEERTIELQNSQEMLVHAQKMEAMGQLAGGIAHDFNNMMQVVIGYTRRTLKKPENPAFVRENLEHVTQAAESAAILTHRLLAFSRKQMLQPSVFILNDMLQRATPMLRHSLGEDITLQLDLHPDLGRVKADPTQLEQVVINMVVNARNAMPHGGELIIKTADVTLGKDHPFEKDPVPPGPYVLLAISDTGCGVAEELLDKIFEPFFTTRAFGTGSGLGLATAYGTVRQSGGVIRVYSQKGNGTTFKIFLPRTKEPIPLKKKETPTPRVPAFHGKTILVVEDNTMAREFVCRELEDIGFIILEAPSSEDALVLALNYPDPIHLLVTDVVLPGKSGVELAEMLHREIPDLQTLFMSGYDKENDVMRKRLTADARLLVKPFSSEQLAAAVGELLNSSEHHLPADPSVDTDRRIAPVNILVVDDDPGVADIIVEVLSEPWNKVRGAENGAVALHMCNEFSPDVVLLDIRLPDMDGYELARRIRAAAGDYEPYIVAISGIVPEGNSAETLFNDFLSKPVDFSTLKKNIFAQFNLSV